LNAEKEHKGIKRQLHTIIFEADTLAGKVFDVSLLIAIVLSIIIVMLESVKPIQQEYDTLFNNFEWIFTVIFTIEYLLRIWITGKPFKYIFSFYGLIDLLSIIPTFVGIFFTGSHSLMVIRTLRLLRVFRILKLARFLGEAQNLVNALKASRVKILVFIFFVLSLTVIMGTLMYLIEGGKNGFTSIPRSIYWAIVTLTTVGYGDIAPHTVLGQVVASAIMIFGYGIIAVPTGIVGAEVAMHTNEQKKISTQACPECSEEGHDPDAEFCKHCGSKL
jgi:voltage-gated potassium channel